MSRGNSTRPSKLRKTPSKDHVNSAENVQSANGGVKGTLDLVSEQKNTNQNVHVLIVFYSFI